MQATWCHSVPTDYDISMDFVIQSFSAFFSMLPLSVCDTLHCQIVIKFLFLCNNVSLNFSQLSMY